MLLNRNVATLLILLICGCSDNSEPEPTVQFPISTLPGKYSGVFPCEDCPGIASTLWLRPDKRFFFSQHYPANEERHAIVAYSLGRWNIDPDEHTISLTGEGPVRRFSRPDEAALLMRTDTGLDHLLKRDSSIADFTATVRMRGTLQSGRDRITFVECLTGFEAVVSRGGDYSRLRNQLRSVGRVGAPNLAELKGRFNWSSAGVLQSIRIDEFGTIRADEGC